MDVLKFRSLAINGDISVKPVTGRVSLNPSPMLYLIMGPTGAGKSSFIEAFADKSQQLSISKNQLEAYTQTVKAYRLSVNVKSSRWTSSHGPLQLYLVDTPGFSDSKISEIEIMRMVREWLKENSILFVHKIFFVTPITDTRLPGSRRKTIKMLQRFLAPHVNLGEVTFVTTMWDMVHNEQTRKRAESNFKQLRGEICKSFFGGNRVSIIQFTNTQNSALKAIDRSVWTCEAFSKPMTFAAPHLYRDLYERIEGALQAKINIESELAQPEAQTNPDLKAIFEKSYRENHHTLTKFVAQMASFDHIPAGFEEAHHRLQASIQEMQRAPPPTFLTDKPSRMPILKGLIRPLVQAAKRRGKKTDE